MDYERLANEMNDEILKLRAQMDDFKGERDAYMESYKGVCKERDLLQKKLDVAINMLQYFTKGWSDNVMANAIYALSEIDKLEEKK